MKTKIFLSVICLCLGFNAMAQRQRHNGHGGAPQSMDMVVDTAIINTMNLDAELVASVLELQSAKAEELKATIIKMAQSRTPGQQPTPEEIADMQAQISNYKAGYRADLRKLLGDENYITYLEKQVDKRPQMGGGPGSGANGNNRPRRGNWGGNQQGQGNWGQGQGQGNWGNQGGFGGNEGFGEDSK